MNANILPRCAELENVKSFTRTNISKPDFTLRKARKSQHFWHFKLTKQNKLFTPTGQFFYTDISVISVTFSNSVYNDDDLILIIDEDVELS